MLARCFARRQGADAMDDLAVFDLQSVVESSGTKRKGQGHVGGASEPDTASRPPSKRAVPPRGVALQDAVLSSTTSEHPGGTDTFVEGT